MTTSLKYFIPGFALIAALALFAGLSHAEVNFNEATQTGNYQTFNFFTATSTTATSTNLTGGGGYFKIAGAKRVSLYFSRAWNSTGNTGSSLFKVQVTPDGTNWYDYGQLKQATTTNNANDYAVRASSFTISAATSTTVASMETLGFYGVRCIVVETTDGSHTCTAAAEY